METVAVARRRRPCCPRWSVASSAALAALRRSTGQDDSGYGQDVVPHWARQAACWATAPPPLVEPGSGGEQGLATKGKGSGQGCGPVWRFTAPECAWTGDAEGRQCGQVRGGTSGRRRPGWRCHGRRRPGTYPGWPSPRRHTKAPRGVDAASVHSQVAFERLTAPLDAEQWRSEDDGRPAMPRTSWSGAGPATAAVSPCRELIRGIEGAAAVLCPAPAAQPKMAAHAAEGSSRWSPRPSLAIDVRRNGPSWTELAVTQ
jgi:hypothetical protein